MSDEVKAPENANRIDIANGEPGTPGPVKASWVARARAAAWMHKPAAAVAAILALCAVLVGAHSTLLAVESRLGGNGAKAATRITVPGVASYAGSKRLTSPAFPVTNTASAQQFGIAAAFAAYYDAHAGQTLLGAPLTPAYPSSVGLVQFFTNGALVQQPAAQPGATASVEPLAVVPALLKAGSLVPVGGDTGSLTYADLRAATATDRMVTRPASASTPSATGLDAATSGPVFIAEGKRANLTVGHVIPTAFWAYINGQETAPNDPNDWKSDIGLPLTEALPATATRDGTTHHLLVQAFTNVVLALDQDAGLDSATPTAMGAESSAQAGASGQPAVGPVADGVAYLRTLAPPAVSVGSATPGWAAADAAILDAPGGAETVHVGAGYPLSLAGGQWVNGALWYAVHWDAPKRGGDGWLPATAVALQAPGGAAPVSSFDVLSPDLAKYLASQGGDTAAVVYDETRNRYYTYNPTSAFTMASSAKVPIMVSFLNWTESQGREPNDYELGLLTAMIENSDNDSAQALYEQEGYDETIASYLRGIGVTDWTPSPDGWGWSTLSPLSMVKILTLLHDGKILTAQDRQLALDLMGNIESDQQDGVGDTAPQGATVQMKDGWVPAPDGLWAMNSSGIVTVGGETYIIAVYSQHLNSLDDGWAIARQVCSGVAAALA